MPARGARLGCWLGGARRGRAVGASAAPCSADFDPPRRTAPARRGAAGSPAPWPFPARGWWSRRPPPPGDRARRGRGGGRVRAYCFLALPLTVYVFSWELSVWSGACIAGRGGDLGARRRHEHRKEAGSIRGGAGRRGPLRRPAVERARKLLSAARWTNFSQVVGLPCLLPSRPAAPSRGGGRQCRGAGDPVRPPQPRSRPGPPRPLLARGLLGNCDLNGC